MLNNFLCCLGIHEWSKWSEEKLEKYHTRTVIDGIPIKFSERQVEEYQQKRFCINCNKIAHRVSRKT